MLSQMFMAKSAFFSYERKMQLIANNISNAQTPGFKKRRVELESIFPLVLERAYSEYEEEGGGQKRKKYMEYGQGIRIVDISKDFTTGTIEVTNQPLDLAIQGRGFFQFRLPDGTMAYSRAGNLKMDPEGNILNPNGHPMEPPLKVPRGMTEFIVNEEGRVFARVGDQVQPQEIGQITLANFQNPAGLKDIGQKLFQQTAGSGDAQFIVPGQEGAGTVKQRSLEYSNVNVVEELMNMLLCQRTFELVTKTVSSADAMLKIASDINR